MSKVYFDASALVKLYISETGSEWVDAIFNALDPAGRPAHQVTFAKIGIVEVAAALARRERMKELSAERRRDLSASFLHDSASRFTLISLTDELLYFAAGLTYRTPLRSYDAVHLAAALSLNQELAAAGLPALTFVTADEQLYETARQQGLQVDNPALHPH